MYLFSSVIAPQFKQAKWEVVSIIMIVRTFTSYYVVAFESKLGKKASDKLLSELFHLATIDEIS